MHSLESSGWKPLSYSTFESWKEVLIYACCHNTEFDSGGGGSGGDYYHYYYYYYNTVPDIGLVVRVFANGPGDLGSVPGRVIPKTQKMVLDASLLNTQHYKVRIKGKVEQSREGVAPSPTPWCSSYRKGSLRVTLDYGRQLYFTLLLL